MTRPTVLWRLSLIAAVLVAVVWGAIPSCSDPVMPGPPARNATQPTAPATPTPSGPAR